MERTLEPEVMDHPDDAEEYDAMDFLETDTRFAEDALSLVPFGGARAVDLGTGTATIPLLLLDRRADVSVIGVDLADGMLELAAKKAASRGVGRRLELLKADVKATGLPAGAFDLVMSNSTLHHVPEPLELFREIVRLLRNDGAILVRDLVRPASTDDAWAIVERVAPNDSPRQKKLFFDSLCAALTLDEVRDIAAAAGMHGARIEMITDRHFTVERSARGALRQDSAGP